MGPYFYNVLGGARVRTMRAVNDDVERGWMARPQAELGGWVVMRRLYGSYRSHEVKRKVL